MAIEEGTAPAPRDRSVLDRALAQSSAEILALLVSGLREHLDLQTRGAIDAVYDRYAHPDQAEIVRERFAELDQIAHRAS